MKVLFVGPRSPDYLASCLWDGLQEVLGEENVYDAVQSPWLHKWSAESLCKELPGIGYLGGKEILLALSGTRDGKVWANEDGFDLLIINASFDRDQQWMLIDAIRPRLKSSAKIAYVEGWDAAWQIRPPQGSVDAVFRKEISRNVSYPYQPHYLTFACPSRWIIPDTETRERPIDLFFSGNPTTCLPGQEVRWPMLGKVFQGKKRHRSVITTFGIGFANYFETMRKSKLALCPSAADLADPLRTFEAVACGAVPIFVGYPDHVRDPWFPGEVSFSCSVDALPEHIDEALANDLTSKRKSLLEHVRAHHTTAARVKQMLRVLGM